MKLAVLLTATIPGVCSLCSAGDGGIRIEAESYSEQQGSTAAFYAMPNASGGKVVDNSWGGKAGDFLRYVIELPRDFPVVFVTFTVARRSLGDAEMAVQLDHQTVQLRAPCTGGWGFNPDEWQRVAVAFGRAGKGTHALEIRSLKDGSNLNIDRLVVSAAPVIPPEPGPGREPGRARLLAPFRERIRRVVFTKHFDMGGSHYAYTDAVSDEDTLNPKGVTKEFNFKGGSSLCLLELDDDYTTTVKTLLEDDDGVFRDPDVSYDGKRILFAWKKSARGDDYHLYEMEVETGEVRQLTFGRGVADYEGVYLPNGDIMFSSTRCFQNVDCWHVSVSNMFIMDGDGKYMRRVGFDQVNTNYPQVHPESGLVTYTRWEYNDRGQIYPQPLFRMFPNGAQQTEFYGNNSYFPTTILHARGIPGTGKVLAVLSGHHTRQRGKLAIIDPALGRQETAGVTLLAPVRKPKGAIRIDRYGQTGDQWQYPYPLDEDNYLVTFRTAKQSKFGVYFMNSRGERALLASAPGISCNQPVPLAPRKRPPTPSHPIDWRKRTGAFLIQDIYHGPGLKGVTRGTVRKVRIVALDYMATDIGRKHGPSPISDLAAWDVKVVLGEAPVYADGSAAFEVPARTPVYFQAIDGNGHVVQTMRSWSTLMPGEVFGCIGCHEDKNEAVPGKTGTMALKKGVQPLQPFYDITGQGFSFPKVIQPIFDRHCVKCHRGEHADRPDLRTTPVWDKAARKFWHQSYHELISKDRPRGPANDTQQVLGTIAETSRYLNWIGRWSVPTMIPPYSHGSSRSPLVRMLTKGHNKLKLTREEMDKIACWIDLALPHSGDWTEGMTSEDKAIYMAVYGKRKAWEKEEAANIAAYVASLKGDSAETE